jgi:glycosyltransferase involved in cell wall biosynthesis
VTDGENWFGIGIEPSSKSIIGSQEIPWIREDRINEDDFINALIKIYEMKSEEREQLGAKGRQHVVENYNFAKYVKTWDELLTNLHTELGSWETRRGYANWHLEELK